MAIDILKPALPTKLLGILGIPDSWEKMIKTLSTEFLTTFYKKCCFPHLEEKYFYCFKITPL